MRTLPRPIIAVTYEEYAREYLRNLPLEHFMESTAQAKQRAITVSSLQIVETRRAGFHVFSELLIQYARKGERRPGQVVPDNMVVLTEEEITADTCYNLPLEPCGPFWVMEYVSKSNRRKDYDDSFDKYERELKVPYYLLFYTETQDLTLYRHTGKKYVSVKPNAEGHYAIPEIESDLAIVDGWVRYWYQGQLLPTPSETDRLLQETRKEADEAKQHGRQAKRQAADSKRREEKARERADAEKQRAETEMQRAETALERAQAERQRAEDLERKVAELEAKLVEAAARKQNGGRKG